MRLATWNVNSVAARLPRLLDWLAETGPDVVCLQETKTSVAGFPAEEIGELGYECAVAGEGRWNGVAVLSRVGLTDVTVGFPGQPAWDATAGETLLDGGLVEARAVAATCGPLRVWSLYVPNGRGPDHPHYRYKLDWLAAFGAAAAAELAGTGSGGGAEMFAACGDFNVAPTDADVWDRAEFEGATHVTPAEREAIGALLALGLTDVEARPLKHDRPFTYWDYRAGAFHKNMGMRIDLVLTDAAATAAVRDAYVDRDARKGKGPSDHAPVVVDLAV